MIITDIPYREFAIPWVNDTCWADPKQLQKAVDHSRSRYQIIELLTNKDRVGLGEVSDLDGQIKSWPAEAPLHHASIPRLFLSTETERNYQDSVF